jgi:hypothetical protein
MVVHAYNPSTQEAEPGGPRVSLDDIMKKKKNPTIVRYSAYL